MTQPYPPGQPVPAQPPAPPGWQRQPSPSTGTADLVVSWIVWVLLLVLDGVIALFMLLAGLVTGLTCGSTSDPAAVCSGAHGDVLWVTGMALWVLMLVVTVTSLVMMIVRTTQNRTVWPWPVVALGLVALGTVAWFGYLAAVS